MPYTPERKNTGFTLLELLVVLAIIGLLTSFILPTISMAREKAYYARALSDFRSINTSIQFYQNDNSGFPADASRDIPPGLEEYISPGLWPEASWPGSVFDWENWDDPDSPGEKIYQISVRFCPIGEPDECRFPNTDWAESFDISSSVYFCISGACRSHIGKPVDHPGYCVNCNN